MSELNTDYDDDENIPIKAIHNMENNILTIILSFGKTVFNINYYFEDNYENRLLLAKKINNIIEGNETECDIMFIDYSPYSKGYINYNPRDKRVTFKYDLVGYIDNKIINYCDTHISIPYIFCESIFRDLISYLE